MKQTNLLLLLVVSLCFSSGLFSQEMNPRCINTVQWQEDKMENDAEYRKQILKSLNFYKQNQLQRNPPCAAGPVIIPVAIHYDSGANLPNGANAAQKQCAIDLAVDVVALLNYHFAGTSTEAAMFDANFSSCFNTVAGATCMEFCLSSENHPPGHNLNPGDPAVTFGTADFNYPTQIGLPGGTPTNPDWSGYFNIYVTNIGGGVLGISNGIPGGFNGDGIMVNACQFGTANLTCAGWNNAGTCGASFNTTQGKTILHEAGHYFGLFHIWGDEFGCFFNPNATNECSGSDQMADTPNMSCSYSQYAGCAPHNTCLDLPSTCGSTDMYMNFMAYSSDPCLYMFTSGQADRMYNVAVNNGYTTTPPASCSVTASPCPPNYVLSGPYSAAPPGQDYETNGTITSTQVINSGNLDYDSQTLICLDSGFEINTSSNLSAFIDGCNSGGGGIVLQGEEDTTTNK